MSPTSTPSSIASLASRRQQFLRFIERRVDSPATAEDILHAAYIRALESSSQLRDAESSVAWFYRILRNAVIDHYRRRAAEDRALDRWAQDLLTQPAPDPLTQQIVCQCILKAIQHLKPAYSHILRQVDLEEMSLDLFAKDSGITAGNAAVRSHRARKALKQQLVETCGACSTSSCTDCTCDHA